MKKFILPKGPRQRPRLPVNRQKAQKSAILALWDWRNIVADSGRPSGMSA
jgi:hypothetical protein